MRISNEDKEDTVGAGVRSSSPILRSSSPDLARYYPRLTHRLADRQQRLQVERLKELERPRPGHADLTGAIKYLSSIRGVLERSSARETAARVAAGSLAKQLLSLFGIETLGYVTEIGGVAAPTSNSGTIQERLALRDSSIVYTLDHRLTRPFDRSSTKPPMPETRSAELWKSAWKASPSDSDRIPNGI